MSMTAKTINHFLKIDFYPDQSFPIYLSVIFYQRGTFLNNQLSAGLSILVLNKTKLSLPLSKLDLFTHKSITF